MRPRPGDRLVLEPDHHDYVTFHLDLVGCPFCQANLADLKKLHPALENLTAEECAEISALVHQTYRLSSLIEDLLLDRKSVV